MRIYVAGASGAIGRRLVPLLVAAGHEVAGMTRGAAGAQLLEGLGAIPVVCDAFDLASLTKAVESFRPAILINQLTDLPDDPARIVEHAAANSRIRREGTANVLAAADAAGGARVIAQSVAWTVPGDGGAAVSEMETMVLGAQGVVLRYGQLYGPGTYSETDVPDHPRIHVDRAAQLTAEALDRPSGSYELVEEA